MNHCKVIFVISIFGIWLYAIFAFYNIQLNPILWTQDSRALYGVIIGLWSVFTSLLAYGND